MDKERGREMKRDSAYVFVCVCGVCAELNKRFIIRIPTTEANICVENTKAFLMPHELSSPGIAESQHIFN